MPVEGKRYTITCVSRSGVKAYMNYDNGSDKYVITPTDGDNSLYPDYATFTVYNGKTEGKYNFVDFGGSFLVFRGADTGGSANGYNSNKGYTDYYASAAELAVQKLAGPQVAGTPRERFGYVTLSGERADASKTGYFVIKNGDTYDGAGDAYFNDTFSSALLIEEATVKVGISATDIDTTSAKACYDMQGRRTTPAEKGIYIINGQKTIVR